MKRMKVLRIDLRRCDEQIKLKSEASAGHALKRTCDLGLNINIKQEDDQIESNSYGSEIPQSTTNYTFGDELEALLKSEPEDYYYQPVTETLTFYGTATAATSDTLTKLNVKLENDEEEDFPGEDPLAEHDNDVAGVTSHSVPVLNFKCTACSFGFKSALDLRRHEQSVHKVIFQCPLCNEYLTEREDVSVHWKTVHQISYDGLAIDPIKSNPHLRAATKGCSSKQKSKVHEWAKVPFTCPICDRMTTTGSIHRHWRDVHKLTPADRGQMYTEYKYRRFDHKDASRNPKLSAKIMKLREEWGASRMNGDLDIQIFPVENFEDHVEEETPAEQLDGPIGPQLMAPLHTLILETKCKVCGFQAESSLDLRRHEINLHRHNRSGHSHAISRKQKHVPPSKLKDTFQCPMCEIDSFRGKRNVFNHMNVVHGLSFKKCWELFPNERKGQEQGQQQDECPTSFTCPLCKNWFTTTIKIRRHWREVHKLPQELRNKLFLECLAQVAPTVQSVEPELSTQEDELDEPLVIWLPPQPESPVQVQLDLKCELCGAGFVSPLNLQRHEISIHGYNRNGHNFRISHGRVGVGAQRKSKVTNYKCPLCKKSFIENRNVHNHMRKIHGLTKEECNDVLPLKWRKGYVSPPSTCSLCQRKFENTVKIHRHLREVHQIPQNQWRQMYQRDSVSVRKEDISKIIENVVEIEMEEKTEELNDPLALDDLNVIRPVYDNYDFRVCAELKSSIEMYNKRIFDHPPRKN